jgi:serine protease inhibitor
MSLYRPTTFVGSLVVLTAAGLAAGCLYRSATVVSEEEARMEADDDADQPTATRLKEVTPEVRDVAKANNDFALDLYARLADDNKDKNLFFSPYSVSGALAMVAEGARAETADEMGKVLRYPAEARRTGERPWDMARIHTGLAALNDHLTAGSRPATEKVRGRLAALRKALQTANAQAKELEQANKWQAAEAEAKKAQALADQLNKLQADYDQYELRVANALWGEKTYGFRQSYLDTIAKHYHTGGMFPVDFKSDFEGARKRINAWVEEQTHERIKDMLPPDVLDEESKKLVRLILTNAIYFKGEWAEVFQEGQTKDDDFVRAGGAKVRVPMMSRGGMGNVRYAAFRGDGTFFDTPARLPAGAAANPKTGYPDERGFAMLEVPYKGGELAMVVIVPRSADGLAELEKGLTAAKVQTWVGKMQKRAVNVFLPKFKVETKYDMGKALKAMGMVRAFKDPRDADGAQFDGMSESEDPLQKLYISKVLHKAFVEVNEKGTEAAAATAVIMAVPLAAPPMDVPFTPTFRADRPFVFLIRDVKTGGVLFLGRVTNPKG